MSNDNLKWATKYRPKKHSEYLGNTHTLSLIKKMIQTEKVPQTLLFTGESGLGKTSIAFLMAMTMKCEHKLDGVSCGECASCVQLQETLIEKGKEPRNSGIYYIDITKANTVDEAKELVNQMNQRRMGNGISIYILDEMQRASQEAQSCFLKIAEDTPENVYIMLCTTNPEKVLKPLANRFHTINIVKPTSTELEERIQHICTEEGTNYTREGIKLLVNKCNKVPRDTIRKAELISIEGEISVENVEKEMKLISDTIFKRYLNTCLKGNLAEIMLIVDEIKELPDYNFTKFINGLGNYLAKLIEVRAGLKLDSYTVTSLAQMRKFLKLFSDKEIVSIIKMLRVYSGDYETMEFKLFSLAVETMEILQTIENVKEVDESDVGARYVEVTREVNSIGQTVEVIPDTQEVSSLFDADVVEISLPDDSEQEQVIENHEATMSDIEDIFG